MDREFNSIIRLLVNLYRLYEANKWERVARKKLREGYLYDTELAMNRARSIIDSLA